MAYFIHLPSRLPPQCSHVRCAMKFAAHGLIAEFLTYMSTLLAGTGPEMGERGTVGLSG